MSNADYWEVEPLRELSECVDVYWFYQPDLQTKLTDILIPEGVIDIVFNFGAPYFRKAVGKTEGEWVTHDVFIGQRTKLYSIEWPINTQLFAIRLRAGAAFALLQRPVNEITDTTLPLAETLLAKLGETLKNIEFENSRQVVKVTNDFLMSLANSHQATDATINKVLPYIKRANGDVDVNQLSNELGLTRRTLERKFAQHIGVAPKLYCRIQRLHHFLRHYRTNAGLSLTGAANEAQFYDQSHFIKEFKAFTGTSPAKFFDSPPEIYEPLLISLMGR
ncbi:MAG: helix-turn-helix domain-containing protein [Alteromonadaceae bacterium]|nr:helix-turn-helix domain-containing protein [Alteromonadaceae bacterium]